MEKLEIDNFIDAIHLLDTALSYDTPHRKVKTRLIHFIKERTTSLEEELNELSFLNSREMQSKYELALNHFLILSNRLKLEYSMQKPILKTFAFYDLAHHHYNDIKKV